MNERKRVVIVGGGFAGLSAARRLRKAPVEVMLIDKRNHHLFQPLLYQVATAALSPAEISAPLRKVLRSQRNARVLLASVEGFDTERRVVQTENDEVPYDYLIVATGATHSYFGHDEWAARAPGLKTVEDATEMRRRFLLAFERAEAEESEAERERLLTFVVVGGGPTGVELAGTMMEIARSSIVRDFRSIDTRSTRVVLVEGLDRVLPTFPEANSASARRQLEQLGVEVVTGKLAQEIDGGGVTLSDESRIEAANVFWAAGVQASRLGAALGAETDKGGAVLVGPDLSIPGHPEVFVAGDLAHVEDPDTGERVPGMAPGALQMGAYCARIIRAEAEALATGRPAPRREPFRYRDKGVMATIGRSKAVASIKGHNFGGFVAWVLWALVHVFFLITFRNRVMVMLSWIWTYVFYDRGARLITGQVGTPKTRPPSPRESLQEA